jgi:hypothetical protein
MAELSREHDAERYLASAFGRVGDAADRKVFFEEIATASTDRCRS